MEEQSNDNDGQRRRKFPRGVFTRNGVFWIRYQDQLRNIRREKVGPFLKQAVAAYQKRKSEVREGKFFPDRMKQRLILFAEIAEDFLAYSKKFKRSYPDDLSRTANVQRLWRNLPLADLSPGRIERDLSECAKQQKWAPATYNRYRALVSAAFSLAIRNGKATTNPVRGTKHVTENNARVRYLTDGEEDRLLKFIRSNRPGREAEVMVALHSGMRRSEQYVTAECPDGGLMWQYVDFCSGVITIPRSKHGEKRHLPMNDALSDLLLTLGKSSRSPYVFPVYPPDEWFPEACKQARIPNFTWHCLRHTFASRLVMAGVNLRQVQELMGHKSILTTMRYAHLAPEGLTEAVQLLVRRTSTATSTDRNGPRISMLQDGPNPLALQEDSWWAHQDSNLGPTDYESAALTN
jgi:integrase